MVGESPVPGIVLFDIGIEQVDGNRVTGHAFHVVTPGSNGDRTAFNEDRDDWIFWGEVALQIPWLVLLGLHAVYIQVLPEIAFPMGQRDRRQPETRVRGSSESVTGQH